jgi:hypothetical protein
MRGLSYFSLTQTIKKKREKKIKESDKYDVSQGGVYSNEVGTREVSNAMADYT